MIFFNNLAKVLIFRHNTSAIIFTIFDDIGEFINFIDFLQIHRFVLAEVVLFEEEKVDSVESLQIFLFGFVDFVLV